MSKTKYAPPSRVTLTGFWILLRPLGFIAPTSKLFAFAIVQHLSVQGEDYSRNASCALNLISTWYVVMLHHSTFSLQVSQFYEIGCCSRNQVFMLTQIPLLPN